MFYQSDVRPSYLRPNRGRVPNGRTKLLIILKGCILQPLIKFYICIIGQIIMYLLTFLRSNLYCYITLLLTCFGAWKKSRLKI